MNHHAYFVAGEAEEGIRAAHSFIEQVLKLPIPGNPDVITLRYDLFSVADARAIADIANRTSTQGDAKVIVMSAKRLFHETQNALLKVFEEPPAGVYLILIVPSEGAIIPTLRSRLLPLPGTSAETSELTSGELFLRAGEDERTKMVEKILNRAKKDSPEEKQAARIEALLFAQTLAVAAYTKRGTTSDDAFTALLADLDRFIPILHERAAPLKPILEHIGIVTPKG